MVDQNSMQGLKYTGLKYTVTGNDIFWQLYQKDALYDK